MDITIELNGEMKLIDLVDLMSLFRSVDCHVNLDINNLRLTVNAHQELTLQKLLEILKSYEVCFDNVKL